MKNTLLLIAVILISSCVITEPSGEYMGIIKTQKLVNNSENQTGIKIVSAPVREIGPDAVFIEPTYIDSQLKALQLMHIIDKRTLSEYLEAKEDAMNDNINPNFQESIAVNIDEVNTPLKEAQLEYILGKITLDEYLENEKGSFP